MYSLYGIGAILMLHRVRQDTMSEFNPNRDMAVEPRFLEAFIVDAIQRGYMFVSLDELKNKILAGSGGRFLSLTFDDGYRDNFITAYPLLKRLGVPFTIYVTTSFPDGTALLWWDAIERAIRNNDNITLADGQVIPCLNAREKIDAFDRLRTLIMSLPRQRLRENIDAMFEGMYFDWERICAAEALSWDEICVMARDPLVTIGAHTVTHPVLASLTTEHALFEMQHSRQRIEASVGLPVQHFCYPFGSRNEVGLREFEMAKALGFQTATTTRWGNIFKAHRTHLHGLPRVPLTNSFSWDGFCRQSIRRFVRGRVISA